MLMIRFQRIGRTNDPAFRIVVLEKERAAKTGSIVEQLGTYNPRTKAITLDKDGVKSWISKGAQPSDSMHNLLINQGVIEGKKRNVLPRKTVDKVEVPVEAAAPAAPVAEEAAPAAEPVVEAVPEVAPEMPAEAEVVAEAEGPAAEVAPEAPAAETEVAEETPAA